MKDYALQVVDHATTEEIDAVLDLKIAPPIRDSDGKITQGGLVIGNTLEQNKAFLLIAHPNDFKAIPTLGIGFSDILLDSNLLEYRHKIREQFARDGLKIKNLDLYSLNNIKIDAHYE
jgi:hypothetical protein